MAVGSQSPVPSSSATTLEDLEVETVLHDSASLELVFQQAVDGDVDSEGDGGDGDEHDDEVENKMENEGLESEGGTMHWVDCFILNTCRKGGRQTETSILKLYKVRVVYHPLHSPILTFPHC